MDKRQKSTNKSHLFRFALCINKLTLYGRVTKINRDIFSSKLMFYTKTTFYPQDIFPQIKEDEFITTPLNSPLLNIQLSLFGFCVRS